jgi:hypothetical protein
LGHAIERGNVRTEHIFSHLPGTEMSWHRGRIWAEGERCIVK